MDRMIRYRGFVIISHDDGRYFTISGHKGHWYSLEDAQAVCDQIRPRTAYPTRPEYPTSLFEQPAPTPTTPVTTTITPEPTRPPEVSPSLPPPTETPTPTPTPEVPKPSEPTPMNLTPIIIIAILIILAILFFGKRKRGRKREFP